MLSLIVPALKYKNKENYWYFGYPFVYSTVILASTINGIGLGFLETAEDRYISLCATEEVKGIYFGIFWAFY